MSCVCDPCYLGAIVGLKCKNSLGQYWVLEELWAKFTFHMFLGVDNQQISQHCTESLIVWIGKLLAKPEEKGYYLPLVYSS